MKSYSNSIQENSASSVIVKFSILVILFFLHFSVTAQKDDSLQLAGFFQEHMVIQRNKPIKIWGRAEAREKIEVNFGSQNSITKAGKDGKWKVEFPALSEKGPYILEVSGKSKTLELGDILIGDVWIASGQSNMEWPLRDTPFKEADSSFIKKGEVRLLKLQPVMDYLPKSDITSTGWQLLSQENIGNFSAVAYHFSKFINQEAGIPVGIISANLGATAVETWMSNNALAEFPQFKREVDHSKSFKTLEAEFDNDKSKWSKDIYYDGIGMKEKWYSQKFENTEEWKPVKVAGNTWIENEDLKNFDGAVWFRKKFNLPENFSGNTFNLQLLQIDDFDITWVNGKKIGETFGKHNHRNYSVPVSDLKETGNTIVVRVFDAGGIGGFTTSAFWGNNILWGDWEYRKGIEIDSSRFDSPELPNVTPFSSPGVLYNGVIAPLTQLQIKGVIWYQGESNEARAYEYRSLFPALIKDWRKQFSQDDFPFLFVQLANYREEDKEPKASKWAEIREAQSLALKELNTEMAVIIDIGEAGDIHPKNKKDVGQRLGMLAMNMSYDGTFDSPGPRFSTMEIKDNGIYISFKNLKNRLTIKNKYGYIRGFQIAGSNKEFHWAQASLKGNGVFVHSDEVPDPVAVRYAWSDNPGELDLVNSIGLPLEPFRTDNWELSTQGVQFEEGPRF
ncbi:sialate O-acetylesterase [Gramella sp. AN32]|uniref:Sialate O-acetylesterase n=1 Tax=Christiangramia antarctica TaxID=2058158 RepID=A0ABW5XB81_9FLAO|nr:sialate O-acetylesterase [Gramella sp. AN32]MCM4157572.1 9-O-acetylesterase [Gramella sp. AN32]